MLIPPLAICHHRASPLTEYSWRYIYGRDTDVVRDMIFCILLQPFLLHVQELKCRCRIIPEPSTQRNKQRLIVKDLGGERRKN
jgi:hypothetical protein